MWWPIWILINSWKICISEKKKKNIALNWYIPDRRNNMMTENLERKKMWMEWKLFSEKKNVLRTLHDFWNGKEKSFRKMWNINEKKCRLFYSWRMSLQMGMTAGLLIAHIQKPTETFPKNIPLYHNKYRVCVSVCVCVFRIFKHLNYAQVKIK